MFFKKKTIHDLFNESIVWTEVGDCEFNSRVDNYECNLRINDFPDEPMYTLTYKGGAIDFDDKPSNWIVPS